MTTTSKAPLLARPRDESLQAFKDWILEFYTFLTGNSAADDDTTEEEWVELHRKFWENPDSAAPEEGDTNA